MTIDQAVVCKCDGRADQGTPLSSHKSQLTQPGPALEVFPARSPLLPLNTRRANTEIITITKHQATGGVEGSFSKS